MIYHTFRDIKVIGGLMRYRLSWTYREHGTCELDSLWRDRPQFREFPADSEALAVERATEIIKEVTVHSEHRDFVLRRIDVEEVTTQVVLPPVPQTWLKRLSRPYTKVG